MCARPKDYKNMGTIKYLASILIPLVVWGVGASWWAGGKNQEFEANIAMNTRSGGKLVVVIEKLIKKQEDQDKLQQRDHESLIRQEVDTKHIQEDLEDLSLDIKNLDNLIRKNQ